MSRIHRQRAYYPVLRNAERGTEGFEMKTKVWIGVACYDAQGTWLGSFPHGQDAPQDVVQKTTSMAVDIRLVDEDEDEEPCAQT